MGQNSNLTLTQHWELHQGLWSMLGCDMKLIYKDRNNNKNDIILLTRKSLV